MLTLRKVGAAMGPVAVAPGDRPVKLVQAIRGAIVPARTGASGPQNS